MIKKNLPLVLTVLVIISYVIIQYSPLVVKADKNAPVITFDKKSLKVSVKDDEEVLLNGVHASDKEDGDVSKNISIEGISTFLSGNRRSVNYVVFDSDNNATKASRTIEYTDYTKPKFSLTDQMADDHFSVSEIMKRIQASSCVDGDISSKISVKNTSLVAKDKLEVMLSVSDSTGSSAYLTLNYHLEETQDINITLDKYLVYLKKGEKFNYRNNIKSIVERTMKDLSLRNYVNIDVPDMKETGVYEVTYSIERSNGNTGQTIMVVVVQ